MTRISCEFEDPDLAELALKRIKGSVSGIYSTNIMYNKTSDYAMKLRNGTIYTVIPTAVTSYTSLTKVMEFPASKDIIEEPSRSRKTSAYIICEPESVNNVKSMLSAMGALKITTPENNA
ncbi:MAG: hypothetical protein LUD57_01905 [Ruminococcus sp.]|nr:hypothetical protein [Ruminococcus sp.]